MTPPLTTATATPAGSPPAFPSAPRANRPSASGAPTAFRAGPSWLAAQGRLPLAFMVLGLVWLGVATTLTALTPSLLATPHIAPAVVGLTHAWVLGFFVTVAVGAMYQLAPVALSTTLWSEKTGWAHGALHAAAVPLMVYAFWHWELRLVLAGGLALLAGILIFAVNTGMTVLRSGKRDAVAWSLALATGWLILTVTAGLLLAANRVWAFWAVDPLQLLRAHAHLGFVGFFITLLQGVTFRLVPMFTLAEVPDWRPVKIGLWLSQLGLLSLAPALACHAGGWSVASGALIVLGLACTAQALRQTLATRKKRALDPGVGALARGCAGLATAAVGGLWLAAPATQAGSLPGGFSANVYGVLIILGGLLPAISGMMNKIVPFLTWMRAYGPKVGRVATPPATALSHPGLERWALRLQAAALPFLLAGAWSLQAPFLVIGATLLAGSTALFLVNMARILDHLRRPVTPTATSTVPAKPVSP